MTIKEVEELTGMTAKSIRLYESKGLIEIERDENNSYRDFSDENVKQLEFIKIMRYLDFSIQEIKDLINANNEIVKCAMEDKLNEYSETEETLKEKKYLCERIAKNYKKENLEEFVAENVGFIEFTESEEYAEIKKTMKELEESTYHPLSSYIFRTLMCLGPILSLIINYAENNYESLKIGIPLCLLGTVLLTLLWRDYFYKRKEHKKLQKKSNKGGWLYIPGVIITLFATVVIALITEILVTIIYAPENYLFSQPSNIRMWVVLAFEVAFIFLMIDVIHKIRKKETWSVGITGFIKKHYRWFIVVIIVLMYFAITSETYVTENEIIYHSWKHPAGITYSYSDVKEISTGYKGNGDFYYKVNLGDRWINFDMTIPNPEEEERYSDTYMEIDEFDEALMKYNPKKTSSHKNEENAYLDERYIEIFGRVIDRK